MWYRSMESDPSDSGVHDGEGRESPAEATPSRRSSPRGGSLGGGLTPERTASIERGIKALFTLLLTALLVYWVAAFYFGVVLFEF